MHLGIRKESHIVDIQKEFSHVYPYLKLEFFRQSSTRNKMLKKAEKIKPGETLERLTPIVKPGSINIDPKKTVAQLVQDFWEESGLSVQVFRKSGNLWIETSLTDGWTLDKQNKVGESFSNSPDDF